MANTRKYSKVYLRVLDILGSYIPIQEEINDCVKQIERIRDDIDNAGCSAVAYDGVKVQTSKRQNSVEDAVVKNIGKLTKLQTEINTLKLEEAVVMQFMECLKEVQDQDQLEVVKLYYVEGLRTIDISRKWGKAPRIVRRKREKATLNLLKVYNERGEEFGFK